jgi:acetyl-CoA acetyltransferase
VQASYYMHRYGTTREQIAIAAAKNHMHGSLNPKAQYRFRITKEELLADRPVSGPLTRAMCAPIGDGAAAAIVCSEGRLRKLPDDVRSRAVRIKASATSGGKHRAPDEPSLSRIAGDRAYDIAGVEPADIDVAEVHDATSFCEIYQMEMLRFCPEGAGGRFVESGATTLGGSIPVNTSGGLVSKGHPIAATGLSRSPKSSRSCAGKPKAAKSTALGSVSSKTAAGLSVSKKRYAPSRSSKAAGLQAIDQSTNNGVIHALLSGNYST